MGPGPRVARAPAEGLRAWRLDGPKRAVAKGIFAGPSGSSREGPGVGHMMASNTKHKRNKRKRKKRKEKEKLTEKYKNGLNKTV